jgi:uncharacterized protein (TIGR02268 family)
VLPSPPSALVALVLFAAIADAAENLPLPSCETGVRYIELTADATGKAHEVCIRPHLTTSLVFDSGVVRVELAGRQRFRVQEGDDGLTLLPVGEFPDGERLPLTVYFQDGAAPASATFLLVVHPSEVERQVVVSRHLRTLASYRQGEQQARAEALRCQEEKQRLQAECSGQGGLTGLIANGSMGEMGVRAQDITKGITQHPGESLIAQKVITYRAVGLNGRGRVAVEVALWNRGTAPWTPMGAALVGFQREALGAPTVWPLEPIPPGELSRVVVEVEVTEKETRGTFTLKVWSVEGVARSLMLGGVTFP